MLLSQSIALLRVQAQLLKQFFRPLIALVVCTTLLNHPRCRTCQVKLVLPFPKAKPGRFVSVLIFFETVLQLSQFITLFCQQRRTHFQLLELLCPLRNLRRLLLIDFTQFLQFPTPIFKLARLKFQALDLRKLYLHLLSILFLYLQQIIRRVLVVFYLQQRIKLQLTIARSFQENRGEKALRYTKSISEQSF